MKTDLAFESSAGLFPFDKELNYFVSMQRNLTAVFLRFGV